MAFVSTGDVEFTSESLEEDLVMGLNKSIKFLCIETGVANPSIDAVLTLPYTNTNTLINIHLCISLLVDQAFLISTNI